MLIEIKIQNGIISVSNAKVRNVAAENWRFQRQIQRQIKYFTVRIISSLIFNSYHVSIICGFPRVYYNLPERPLNKNITVSGAFG